MQQYLEITEMPEKALNFWKESPEYKLPLNVPYLGMGSSYFAPLAFKFMGQKIYPELASEFYNYPLSEGLLTDGVILSQSGRSSEALWCSGRFQKYTAIVNYTDSPLATNDNVAQVIALQAGDEQFSSSKTYANTLLALFKGFGLAAGPAVDLLVKNFSAYEAYGGKMADEIFSILNKQPIHGIYITGSGPNIATALQAALILSESTKINFHGLAMAQYDHGPKETAINSIVIQIISKGNSYERSIRLADKISASGAKIFVVEEPEAEEYYSVIHNIIPFNFLAYYLAKHLKIEDTFTVGGKVTEVL
jgi:glucosamine--fructose-6-phosphate aminotransferase (isomerizing)